MSSAVPPLDSFDLSPTSPWGRSLTKAEETRMFSTGRLDGPALERFWRMNDFQSPMPAYLNLMVNKRDIEKLARDLKKKARAL